MRTCCFPYLCPALFICPIYFHLVLSHTLSPAATSPWTGTTSFSSHGCLEGASMFYFQLSPGNQKKKKDFVTLHYYAPFLFQF
ncbi:hypothetical protein BDQ17DRAFT_1352294 [Cyathus striatus]|nr:hypothetical protein BDQ17DRAFT_1352294 [Cyathus striatus]